MVTFRENHSVTLNNNGISNACMYDDTIYILCFEGRENKLYSYKSHIPIKILYDKFYEGRSHKEIFKINTNAPPEIIEIISNASGNFTIRNLHTQERMLIDITLDIYYHDFRYIDNKLIITSRKIAPIIIYDVVTKEISTYNNDCRVLDNFIYNADKIYLIKVENEKRIVKCFDINTGKTEDLFEYNFSINRFWEYTRAYIFELDDMIYFMDYSERVMYCYNKKAKNCFRMKCSFGKYGIYGRYVINKKSNKIYSICTEYIREYDIIRGTLFKSPDLLVYSDIDIVAIGDE